MHLRAALAANIPRTHSGTIDTDAYFASITPPHPSVDPTLFSRTGFTKRRHPLELEEVADAVAKWRCVSRRTMAGPGRYRSIAAARQAYCLIAYYHTRKRLQDIATLIGGRANKTLLQAVRRAILLIQTDQEFAIGVAWIEDCLGLVQWGNRK